MMDATQKIIQNIKTWLFNHGIKVIAIIILAYFIRRFAGIFIEKFIRKIVIFDHFLTKEAEKKREDTLIRIFTGSPTIQTLNM